MAMAGADAGCGAAASARRTSILGGLQNMGRRMSQTLLGPATALDQTQPQVLVEEPGRGGAGERGPPSASFKKDRFRDQSGGSRRQWSTLGNVFGSARSTGTAISADGSVDGRAWPPKNWKKGASFKQPGQAQPFNIKKALARTQTMRHSERSERLGKCVQYVNAIDGEHAAVPDTPPEDLSRWEVLYCGGASKVVTDMLEEVTSFLGVTLMTEQFNW